LNIRALSIVSKGPGAVAEIEIVEALRRRARHRPSHSLVLGIGDDCAIFRPPGAREDLLFTTDMLLEDVHFRRATHRAADVGHKALARGLSDIAAMGAEPRFCLVSLALAPWADRRWFDDFYRGLLRLARRHGCALAGGDLARAERFACDIVVCGAVPKGRALRRDGARAGDGIFVSGKLGGSAQGLETGAGAGWRRHLRPQPRIELGRFLRDTLHATAAMDLSDGLSLDLRRLCLASGVAADIQEPPRSAAATRAHALHGGEDYELLFTLRPGDAAPARFGSIPLTRIGTMRRGRAGEVRLAGRRLAPLGYDHFRNS
jgi:thiamine-monophosphate kinase